MSTVSHLDIEQALSVPMCLCTIRFRGVAGDLKLYWNPHHQQFILNGAVEDYEDGKLINVSTGITDYDAIASLLNAYVADILDKLSPKRPGVTAKFKWVCSKDKLSLGG
jgi:hypothetical protein